MGVRKNGSSFDLLVDSTAEQLDVAAHLFQKGLYEKGSFAAGFAAVFNDTYAIVGEEVKHSGTLVQVASGTALGVVKIFGSIPFAMVDYTGKIIDESPKGISHVTAMMIVEGVKGIVAGGVHIVGGIGDLITGKFSGQSIFDISFKVSEVGSEAALMIAGAVCAVKGVATVADSISFSIGGSGGGGVLTMMPSLAVADAGALVSGAGMFGGGTVSMFAATPSDQTKKYWTDDDLADVLEGVRGNRKRAEEKTGIERHKIRDRIDQSADGSKLSKWKNIKGRQKKVVTEDELFEALEGSGCKRKDAAEKLGISTNDLRKMIDDALPDSRVARYKIVKGKGGRKEKIVTEDQVADALEKTGGRYKPAEKILGVDRHKIKNIVEKSGPKSRLARFKGGAKMGTGKGLKEKDIVDALVDADGDIGIAAKRLGKDPEYIIEKIKDAESGSELADFAEEWDGFTRLDKNPDMSPPDDGFDFRYIEDAPRKMTLDDVDKLGPPAEL